MRVLIIDMCRIIGINLYETLKNIRDGKDRREGLPVIDSVDRIEIPNVFEFVSKEKSDLTDGNDVVVFVAGYDIINNYLDAVEDKILSDFAHKQIVTILSKCPSLTDERVIFRRLKQAFSGKFAMYCLPDVFGKWDDEDKPEGMINSLCICRNNASFKLKENIPSDFHACYIDDVIDSVLTSLRTRTTVPISEYGCNKSYILDFIDAAYSINETLLMPKLQINSFEKKLLSTFISYIGENHMSFNLRKASDERGSFTELLKCCGEGQSSINISNPKITKGEHWHHSKWEIFVVVKGKGLIQLRKIGTEQVYNFEVTGDKPEAVYMIPGYTHNLINCSDSEDMVTYIWANETFDPAKPDTYRECVN